MSGPVPSNLVLLSSLTICSPGTKVRFLGCVDDYVVKTATLRLKHNYPVSEPALVVDVDIELILEVMKRNYLDVGTWLNVIGHVQHRQKNGVSVQAVAIWDAGNVDLVAYQTAVEKRNQAT